MEFLQSMDPSMLEKIYFVDELEAHFEEDVVGYWITEISPAFYKLKKSILIERKVRISICGGVCGSHLRAFVNYDLVTEEQVTHDYAETDDYSMDKNVSIERKRDGSYIIKKSLIEYQNQVSETSFTLANAEAFGFITEGIGIILQRLISITKALDILYFFSVDSECNRQEVIFAPHGIGTYVCNENDYEVFKIDCEIKEQGRLKTYWESFFSCDGKLMLCAQNGVPVFFHIPPPSKKGGEIFPVYFKKKIREKYLRTIGSAEVRKVLFSEYAKTLDEYGNEFGYYRVSVKETSFLHQHCLHVEVNTLFKTKEGTITSCFVSHLSYQLEMLEYRQFDTIQSDDSTIEKILAIYQIDENFILKRIIIDGKDVKREKHELSSKNLDGFISEASNILIQRILALRDFEDYIEFISIDENSEICHIIYRPIEAIYIDNEKLMGIECVIVSQKCPISIWKSYIRSSTLTLHKRMQHGFPLIIETWSPCISPHEYNYPEYIFLPRMFVDGYQFLHTIDFDELYAIIFPEKLKVYTEAGYEVGDFRVSISSLESLEQISVEIEFFANFGNVVCHTIINADLTPSLDTVQQTIHDRLENTEGFHRERKTLIWNQNSVYMVRMVNINEDGVKSVEKVLAIPEGFPFISEAAGILLQRLMIRRKIFEPLYFFSFRNSDLQEGKIRYHILPKEWKSVAGEKVMAIGINCSMLLMNDDCILCTSYFDSYSNLICRYQMDCFVLMKIVEPFFHIDEEGGFTLLKHEQLTTLGPKFFSNIDSSENSSIFTSDYLTIASSNYDELGTHKTSVDIINLRGHKTILVTINSVAILKDSLCGTSIISFLDMNLETILYKQIDYCETKSYLLETRISVERKEDSCIVQCWSTDCDKMSSHIITVPSTAMKNFVSEASALIIQRLMILRRTDDVLEYFSFDKLGKRSFVQFTPLVSVFLQTVDGELELARIQTSVLYSDGKTACLKTEFTKSGIIVNKTQADVVAKMTHVKLLDSGSIGKIKYNFSIPYVHHYLSTNLLNCIQPSDIEEVLESMELIVLSKYNESIGKYSISITKGHFEGLHCILVKIICSMRIHNGIFNSSLSALLSSKLKTLKQEHIVSLELGDATWNKTQHYYLRENHGVVINTNFYNKVKEKTEKVFINKVDDFITEAASILLQKILIKKGLHEILKFNSVDIDGCKCEVTFCPLSSIPHHEIFDDDVRINGIEINISPYKKSSSIWHSYFSISGDLWYYKPLGFPCFFRTVSSSQKAKSGHFILERMYKNYFPKFEIRINFVQMLRPEDFSAIVFTNNMSVYSESDIPLGKYLITVDGLHLGKIHCLRLHLFFCMKVLGKVCGISTDSVITYDLKTLYYKHHRYVESCDFSSDNKTFIGIKNGDYILQNIETEKKEMRKWTKTMSETELNGLCTEATTIVLLQLLVRKRYFQPLEFITLDTQFEIRQIQYSYVGSDIVHLCGYRAEILKMQASTFFKNKANITWLYDFNTDGYLISKRQVGIPIKMVSDFLFPIAYLGKRLPDEYIISEKEYLEYLQRNPNVNALLVDLLHFILVHKMADVFFVIATYISKYID